MCPTRIDEAAEPIELNLTAALLFEHGLGRAELLQLSPQLDSARQQLLAAGNPCSPFGPQTLLDDYQANRHHSTLAQILSAAKRLRDLVDRTVILASPPLISAAQILFTACCHPHHNLLSRGERGGRPRILFALALPDNDALQGLLDLLPHDRQLHTVDDRWGMVALDCGINCDLLAGLQATFWEKLQSTTEPETEGDFAIAVAPNESPLMLFAEQTGCQQIIVEGSTEQLALSPWSSAFHPGVLLSASVMGMDIVKLLRGAAMLTERFIAAPPGNNPALDLAGLRHLLAARRNIQHSRIKSCDAALKPIAQLNNRNFEPEQHLLIQLIPQALRRDTLRVTMRAPGAKSADLKRITKTLPELAIADANEVREARTTAGQPTAVIRLPLIDESSLGQLLQLLSLNESLNQLLTPDP